MNLNQLNKIKTPDSWINDTLDFKSGKKPSVHKRITPIIAACLVTLTLTTGVCAMVLPSFSQWIYAQFGKDVEITKLVGYQMTENGFFIKDGVINYFDGQELVSLQSKSINGQKVYNNKTFDFNFDYVIKNGKIYTQNMSDNIISVTSFDNNTAIIWLDMGTLWNSYFIDLNSGKLKPIVDEDGYSVNQGKLKLATDVQVSENQKYLLYRSNRFTSKTDGNKGEWFVQEVATGKEILIKKASTELFSNEIGFIDETNIAICYNDELCPMIYDCKTNEYTIFDIVKGSEFGNSLIYYVGYKDGIYTFKDIHTERTYKLNSKSDNNAVVVTRELICLLSPEGNIDLYLIDQNKTISFKSNTLCDVKEINDIKILQDSTYALATTDEIYIVTK